MRPEFEMFKLVGAEGSTTELPINANLVISVVPITIESQMLGPTGESVKVPAAGLDVGFRIIPVDCSVKEAIAKLEGHSEPILRRNDA